MERANQNNAHCNSYFGTVTLFFLPTPVVLSLRTPISLNRPRLCGYLSTRNGYKCMGEYDTAQKS